MTATETGKAPRIGKRRRRLRLACWGVFLLWFTWFAYVRITTPPAALTRPTQPGAGQRRSIDDELFETIQTLPFVPAPTSAPALAVWWWSNNVLTAGVLGEWSPDPNTAQAVAIQYINKSSTREALDRIAILCAECREASTSPEPLVATRLAGLWTASIAEKHQEAVAALVFRARYRVVEKHDLAGALVDLRAAAEMGRRQQYQGLPRSYALRRFSALVDYELGCRVQEAALPPDLAREMIAFLRDDLSLSVADVAIRVAQADRQIGKLLDRYYTDNGRGDGWLVLSAASDAFDFGLGSTPAERSRLWNVFAPLFNRRSVVREKLLRLGDDLRRLDGLDFEQAQRLLSSRARSRRAASVLDGPTSQLTEGIGEYTFNLLFGQVTHRRALVVMLGLSAYRHDHGTYPDSLEALVSAYLAEVPLDAFTQQPFRYRKLSASKYELGPAHALPGELYQDWWMPELGYEADSYLPQRSPEKP